MSQATQAFLPAPRRLRGAGRWERRVVAFALAGLTVAVASTLRAQTTSLTYSASQSRYRIVRSLRQTQEVLGQRQESDLTISQQVLVSIVPRGADTLAVSIVADTTMQGGSAPPIDMPPAGLTVSGLSAPSGRMISSTVSGAGNADTTTSAVDQLRRFLPVLGGGAAAGSTWRDSVSSTFGAGPGSSIRRESAVDYSIIGDTTYDGERAWRVRFVSATSFAGSIVRLGTSLGLSGTSQGQGVAYVRTDGVLLAVRVTEEQHQATMAPGSTTPLATAIVTATSRVDRVGSR